MAAEQVAHLRRPASGIDTHPCQGWAIPRLELASQVQEPLASASATTGDQATVTA